MKVEEKDSEIVATVDGESIKYRKNDWCSKENFLTASGVEKLEAWKIDLITNHGVDLNELQN